MQRLLAILMRLTAGFALLAPAFGCAPVRALNALVPSGGYEVEAGVAYGPLGRQKLDVYKPEGADGVAEVVVFFYGGSWQYGGRGDYRFVGQALASRGFVAVIADYRLHPEVVFPAFVEDGAKAVTWTRESIGRFGGDPEKIHVMGHSAGAHIAAMLALDRRYLEAEGSSPAALAGMIGLSGPYDFLPITQDDIKAVFATEDKASTQPITFASGEAPPMLLITGDEDVTVKPRNSLNLAAMIEEQGGEAALVTIPGIGHIGTVLSLAAPFRWLAPVLDEVEAFIRREDSAGQPPAA